jgi:tryptophan synthase alpha chain
MSTEALESALSSGRKGLIPFLMAGHPTPEAFKRNLREAAGFADVIEVGVPFSDPLADGPVIQAAAATGLRHGTTLQAVLDAIRDRGLSPKGTVPVFERTREDSTTGTVPFRDSPPIVLMLGINQVLAYGLQRFAERAREAGVSGAIIPDLPFEESTEVREALTRQGLALVPMVAPTTPDDRKGAILRQARGFAYLISVAGVTGARDAFPPETIDYIRRCRELSPVPVCVGFGISGPRQIEQLHGHADGFIVGSALIRGLDEGRSVTDVLGPLKESLTGVPS